MDLRQIGHRNFRLGNATAIRAGYQVGFATYF